MTMSIITTRTALISESARTLPVVESPRPYLRIAARLSRCPDSVGCIIATPSRPNRLLTAVKTAEKLMPDLGRRGFPTPLRDVHSDRRPPAKRCCLRKAAARIEKRSAYSFEEPQLLKMSARNTALVALVPLGC